MCQVPSRFLKSSIGAGKEVKVKKDLQSCFAVQKPMDAAGIDLPPPGNFPMTLKITSSSNFKNLKGIWENLYHVPVNYKAIFSH